MSEFMTIKDFVSMTGLNRMTITRAIKKLYPEKLHKGIITKLNKNESENILKEIRLNDLPNLNKNVQVAQVNNINTELINLILTPILKQQQEFNIMLIKELKEIKNTTPQIEMKQDYFSILGYCNLKKMNLNFSDAIKYGKEARKISNEKNIEIRKIQDERFGYVNSYHIEVLQKVFEI